MFYFAVALWFYLKYINAKAHYSAQKYVCVQNNGLKVAFFVFCFICRFYALSVWALLVAPFKCG